MGTKLINDKTGLEVKVGDTVTDFRGDTETLNAVYPLDGANGKVQFENGVLYYPSVIGCTFVEGVSK